MKKQLITFLSILTGIVSYGQTSVVASGGSVSNNSGTLNKEYNVKRNGFSVRCLKDWLSFNSLV